MLDMERRPARGLIILVAGLFAAAISPATGFRASPGAPLRGRAHAACPPRRDAGRSSAPRAAAAAGLRQLASRMTDAASNSRADRPPEALADTVYNFAFGSNLSPEKRSSRGVNGTGIVSRATIPAVVKGFRLAFNLPMFPPIEPGMAALARARDCERDSCHGFLLELTNEEYQKMWASEGGNAAKPPYEETVVEAVTYEGRMIRAIAFTAANHTCADYELPPSTRYKDIVLKGARESGLDGSWVAHLEKIPAAAPTPPVKLLCACYLALSAVLFRLTGGFAGNDVWWAKGIRAATGTYRDLLKVVYRIALPGGSLRLDTFPSTSNTQLGIGATAAVLARRAVAEALIFVCLVPGAVLGLLTAAMRLLVGKKPFTSMMGAPPTKKPSDK